MSNLMNAHYDPPQSHSQSQTRWVLLPNKKIFAPSLKCLNVLINPNQESYFPALVGVYASVKRFQLYLDKKLIYKWDAQEILPYLIAGSGDNEKQVGINKVLYNTGNNCEYDNESGLLTLSRNVVDASPASMKLSVFCDLLNNIQVINQEMEIIVEWENNLNKMLVPVDSTNPPTSVNIQAPYLSYETLAGDYKQPDSVLFRNFVRDQLSIPSTTSGTTLSTEIRSNAFNQKTIGRLMFTNTPISILSGTPNAEAEKLYNLFGYYMSIPMSQEIWNIAQNGRSVMTFRNISSDAVKLSITNDTWGPAYFTTGAHSHRERSVLKELDDDTESSLNGYASYGCVELNQYIAKDLQVTYSRRGENMTTLSEQLLLNVIAEVKCVYENGHIVYL